MKKVILVLLVVVLAVSALACGNNAIVGKWALADGDGGDYGAGIEFTKDGKLQMNLNFGDGEALGVSSAEWEEAMDALSMLAEIKYKVKNDSMIELEAGAFMGLGGTEKMEVEYSLNGDTLVFDGSTYKRVA